MKKIILLLILQITVLMAADFTMSKSGTLTKESTTTSTQPVATVPPVSQSGIIPNSVDQIWEDMNGANTGWVSNMPSGFGQFQGPVSVNLPLLNDYNTVNMWLEVEAAGNGSSCSPDINTAVNTRVEIGWTRIYIKRNGVWTHPFPDRQLDIGAKHPTADNLFAGNRGCTNVVFGPTTYQMQRVEPSGFYSVKPMYNYRWHAWNPGGNVTPISGIQAVYGVVYMRLIVEDPSKADDRHLANYVAHIASDRRMDGTYVGDIGMSRYKKITNDWVAFNFFTYMTKDNLLTTPPPIILEP